MKHLPQPNTGTASPHSPTNKLLLHCNAFIESFSSPHTRKAYRIDVQQYVEWLGDVGLIPECDGAIALAYKRHLLDRCLKATSLNRKLYSLKALYDYLAGVDSFEGLKNPFEKRWVKREPEGVKEKVDALTRDEVVRLFRAPLADRRKWEGKRFTAYLALTYLAGLRIGEARAVRCCDLKKDAEARPYLVLPKQKGRGAGEQPIAYEGWEMLDSWRECLLGMALTSDPTIPLLAGPNGKVPPAKSWARWVKKAAIQAGIKKNISTHSGRATAITTLLNNGTVLPDVQAFSRHKSINTVMEYHRRAKGREGNAAYSLSYASEKN